MGQTLPSPSQSSYYTSSPASGGGLQYSRQQLLVVSPSDDASSDRAGPARRAVPACPQPSTQQPGRGSAATGRDNGRQQQWITPGNGVLFDEYRTKYGPSDTHAKPDDDDDDEDSDGGLQRWRPVPSHDALPE